MAQAKEVVDPLVVKVPSKFSVDRYATQKRPLDDPLANFERSVKPASIESKQQALESWANKVLTPPIEMNDPNDNDDYLQKVDPKDLTSSMSKAVASKKISSKIVPTKAMASVQQYVSSRWMQKLRVQAMDVYLQLQSMLAKIDDAIDEGKVSVRVDHCIFNNVGLQKFVLGLVHSVYPIWLRIGLETVYGEEIQVKNNDRDGLTRFMLERLFNDPELQEKHGTGTIHYYKDEYGPEVAKVFLKNFLRIFIFLDAAKTSRLIKHDPCLFVKKSQQKSVKSVFAAFTTVVLSGDGNLFKLLDKIDCRLKYEQKYVDEVHYVVNDLMTDLRDGVILCRIVELLTNNYTLLPNLRCPPVSLLQKQHNVKVALDSLAIAGVDVKDIPIKKIVAGDRDKTMALLDRMMLHFHNIKIGDGAAELMKTIIRFQAFCKGCFVRNKPRIMETEVEKAGSMDEYAYLAVSHISHVSAVSEGGVENETPVSNTPEPEVEKTDNGIMMPTPTIATSASRSAVRFRRIKSPDYVALQLEAQFDDQLDETDSGDGRSSKQSMDSAFSSISPSESVQRSDEERDQVSAVEDIKAAMDSSMPLLTQEKPSSKPEEAPMDLVMIPEIHFDSAQHEEFDGNNAIAGTNNTSRRVTVFAMEFGRLSLQDDEPVERPNEGQRYSAAATIIQSRWRGALARRRFKLEKAKAEEAKRNRAAVVIQAAWRGYRFRRNPANMPAVVHSLLERIAAATENATAANTVGARTTNGLDFLLNRDHLSHIKKGLEELLVVSRLSQTSCFRLVENGAVDVLFKLIHQMNMSIASQQITELAISIMLNLAKFDKTRGAISNIGKWFAILVERLDKFQHCCAPSQPVGERIFTKIALILIILRQSGNGDVDLNQERLSAKKQTAQKLHKIRTSFASEQKRLEAKKLEKKLQEKGKTEVVRGKPAVVEQVKFWRRKTIVFTPDWDLTVDKPNENISRYDAVEWLCEAYHLDA